MVTLVVAHYSSAEMGVFRALGWPRPKYLLDTFTEFRARTNGRHHGASLIAAATYFGIDAIESAAKKGGLFSYIAPDKRVPANHPLRKVRELVRDVLSDLNRSLGRLPATQTAGFTARRPGGKRSSAIWATPPCVAIAPGNDRVHLRLGQVARDHAQDQTSRRRSRRRQLPAQSDRL